MSSPAAAASIICLGMDVHKDSITIAVLPLAANTPTRLERLPNDLPKLKRFLDRVARMGNSASATRPAGPGTCHYILEFLARRGFVYRDGTNWCTRTSGGSNT